MKLDGRAVLVIGGGSGIGQGCAEACADDGAVVMVADLNEEAAAAVADGIRSRGGDARSIRVDITDGASVKAATEATVAGLGSLGGLVTSAGAMVKGEDLWNRTVDFYLRGPYYACKYALEQMEAAGQGSIVNISSMAGIKAPSFPKNLDATAYPSAKHGIIGLTRTIAVVYATKGIRANAVCPGWIRTGVMKPFYEAADGGDELINDRLKVPMARWGEPIEIGRAAAFLLSDEASFVTGQALAVDGGLSIH